MLMDLTTTYLGLKLRTPLVPSPRRSRRKLTASNAWKTPARRRWCSIPCSRSNCARSALELNHHMESGTFSFPEALTYFPEPEEYRLGPEEYLKHIAEAKKAVRIPIIASINASVNNGQTMMGGWTQYVKLIQQAGADALELNIYYIPHQPDPAGR